MAGSGQLLKVAVVGTGKMGQCLAGMLKNHCQLTLCGRDQEKASSVAARLGVASSNISECVSSAEVIIAAIPSSALPSFARQVCSRMKPSALFADISSVKCGIIDDISEMLPKHAEYASIHPLFSSARCCEKNILFIPVRCSITGPALRGLLAEAGGQITETNAEEHDRLMAIVQVTQHFALLSMRSAIAKLRAGQELDPFSSYSFRRSLSMLKLIEGNLETVEFIQRRNKFAASARALFMQESVALDKEYGKG